jgi:hypothetical protein
LRRRLWIGLALVGATGATVAGCATANSSFDAANLAVVPHASSTPLSAAGMPLAVGTALARVPATSTPKPRHTAAPSATPASQTASASTYGPPGPSGQAMPVGNIPGWNQVFADDFVGQNVPIGQFPSAVSSQWTGYGDGSTDTTGNGEYMPSQVVSIHNGMMDLYLHTANGVHMVAAPEPIIPNAPGSQGGLLYGMYEIRFMADPVPGYKTAWLLWPDSEDWNDGEIDFPEGNLNSTITASMHHVGDPEDEEFYNTSYTYGTWHTAIIQWTPQSVIFTLDGQVIGDDTNTSLIPSTPMHWVLQTETQLSGGPPSDSASGHVYIAWVTAYARA